jgi:hypothetical protein
MKTINGRKFYTKEHRSKMTLQDFKSEFAMIPPPHYISPDGLYPERDKTRRQARHNHKPTWKPAKANMSPAEWKRIRRAKTNTKKAGVRSK